jgi:hypothetical protein
MGCQFSAICKVVAPPVGNHLFPVNDVRRLRRRSRRNSATPPQRRSRSVPLCDKNGPFVASGPHVHGYRARGGDCARRLRRHALALSACSSSTGTAPVAWVTGPSRKAEPSSAKLRFQKATASCTSGTRIVRARADDNHRRNLGPRRDRPADSRVGWHLRLTRQRQQQRQPQDQMRDHHPPPSEGRILLCCKIVLV